MTNFKYIRISSSNIISFLYLSIFLIVFIIGSGKEVTGKNYCYNLFQLKTILRLADEDMENVTVHGNSFVFRCNQSGISKSFNKYTFDQIFASDATIVRHLIN